GGVLDNLITHVALWIIGAIAALGYAGVALLMAVESAGIPLPSEIIMPFAGYLVSTGRFDLVLAATAGAIGCNIGSSVAYAIAAYGGRPLVERWGSWVLIDARDLALVDRFFARFGAITVFIGRLLPVVRTFIALPAGLARMNQAKFQLYTFLGSWPWCLALAYAGDRLGTRWHADPRLARWMHRFDGVIVAAIVLALGLYIHAHWRHRLRADAPAHQDSAASPRYLRSMQRAALPLVLFGSIAVIAGALLFQYVGGLAPCELCLLERWPYYIAIPVTLLALAAGRHRRLGAVWIAVVVVIFLASTGLGFYHVGVEHQWFAGPTACTGSTTAHT
ncbi:MAG: VTT domain-containing protein, partial [Acetobacteraceae bacterium]